MTDRELLEQAAKAAGIEWDADLEVWAGDCRNDWNPLDNDGDALRLAVKLDIGIDDACVTYSDGAPADPYAAMRRAIVRAAAAR